MKRTTDKRKKAARDEVLANQIGKVAVEILVAVFTVLVVVTVLLTSNTLSSAIGDFFTSSSQRTGQQISSILEKAESAGDSIESYLQKAYTLDAQGCSNMAGEKIKSDRSYRSIIYGTEITELNADVEKYITETARTTVFGSDAIVGLGVMFEPKKYDSNIDSYAFYISSDMGENDAIEPFGEYAEYSQEDYYQEALKTKKALYTDPYEYDGVTMVTYAVPIVFEDEVQGVIMADINVDFFGGAFVKDDNYPSMYITVYNEKYIDVYDSETAEDIGKSMDVFFKKPKELAAVKAQMSQGQAFVEETTREDGRKIERYFSPVAAGGNVWWSMTALDKSERNKATTFTVIIMIIVSLVSLVIIVGVLVSLLKRKLKPIEIVVNAAEQIAQGNLEVDINIESKDEIGKLGKAFELTVERLRRIIGDIDYLLDAMAGGNFAIKTKEEESYVGEYKGILLSMRKLNANLSDVLTQIMDGSDQVALGSAQMAESAQGLAEGATEQAGAVEELTATVENVSSAAEDGAEKAGNAYKQSRSFETEAENSRTEMSQLMLAMGRISDTSQKIAQIISEIEDIASQTNLLSLNASIEAARAGEAGKGFAVVADQIGKLATDSAQSAVNTRELIEKSIEEVSGGNKITENTSQSLEKVIGGIKLLAESAKDTSELSAAQAEAMKQVAQGIEQISGVVQSNSAAAEETSATSEELSAQSENLKALVDRFQLKK